MMNLFNPLFDDLSQTKNLAKDKPLLAHYTSISTLESIVSNDEIWFSNPLMMNDMDELRFGILESTHRFLYNSEIQKACDTTERFNILSEHFDRFKNIFDNDHAFDVYVFCFSEHDKNNDDGLLSMWRGYGANGNGAAIIFDSSKLKENESSPFLIMKVEYLSKEKRYDWIDKKFSEFAKLLETTNIPDDHLYVAAYMLFERIKIFALTTKHDGFSEEKEWRVIYLKERDQAKYMDQMLCYHSSKRGLEPKLKFKIKPINGLTTDDFLLTKIIDKIILGPAISSVMTRKTVERMLEKAGKTDLKKNLISSTIPFRAT